MEFVDILGWISFISAIVLQLVGIEVCQKIVKKGTTGDISPVPFLTYFVCACLWIRYALMRKIPAILYVNVFASLLQFTYLLIFYIYTLRKNLFAKQFLVSSFLLFLPLMYIKYFADDETLAAANLGLLCVACSIMAYGAPLASLKVVLKNKSTECMSFPLVLANFIVAIEWYFYGVMVDDGFVQFSNGTGIFLSLVQISLFMIYPSSPSPKPHSTQQL